MDLTFVSTNEGKFREVRTILEEYGVRTLWNRRALLEVQSPRLETVVVAKLEAASSLGTRVLVEDSGLFIAGLHGFPGVYSAYALDTIGLEGVLRLTRGHDRRAIFRTVAGLAIGKRRWTRTGECAGRIADRPHGNHGFGFDPIFIAEGETRTFGQLSPVEKNRRSHRARAIHQVGRLLRRMK